MNLVTLIQRGGLQKVAAVTVATAATQGTETVKTVAPIATVAVVCSRTLDVELTNPDTTAGVDAVPLDENSCLNEDCRLCADDNHGVKDPFFPVHDPYDIQTPDLESRLLNLAIAICIDERDGSALPLFSESDIAAAKAVAKVHRVPLDVQMTDRQKRELLESLMYFDALTTGRQPQ